MAFFRTTKQLYVVVEQLFFRIMEEDARAGEAMASSRMLVHMQTTEPEGLIVINGRVQPVRFLFGVNESSPDLQVTLSGDALHQILLGELGLRQAMSLKQLQVKGPIFKMMLLLPLFQHTQRIYPTILREQGLR
ncbi:MAG: SCP2 sterol-binding domain-containing protein [Anaerolineales bacterium]|nr:SCP2 sterol-binding domain-containing protein [Anaerolineales bacterium]